MRKQTISLGLVFLLLMTGFAGVGVAQETPPEQHVRYDITYDAETDTADVTVAVTVSDTKKYDSWTLSWDLPKDSTLQSVETATSETVNVKQDGTTLEIKETDGESRQSETFYITYTTQNRFKETEYGPVTQLQGQFSALSNASSYVEITVTNATIANTFRYTNHSVTTTDQTTRIGGTGPVTFITNIKHTNATVETDDYAVYNANISTTALNNSYAISTIGTGTIPQIHQMPVIVISAEQYTQRYSAISAGQFNRGVIILSNDTLSNKRQLLPLLTHEYTHAITERIQPSSPSRWFTEGVSQYTESIARENVNARQTTIDEDKFWNYHTKDESWVEQRWASGDEEDVRFAYAYSELLVKHSERSETTTVRTLFKSMASGTLTVTQSSQPTVLYGDSWTGQVCKQPTRTQTIDCAEESLSYIPSDEPPSEYTTPFNRSVTDQNITIEQVSTPTPPPSVTDGETDKTSPETDSDPETNTTDVDSSQSEETTDKNIFEQYLEMVFEMVVYILRMFFEWLLSLF